jgi:hypothetical protein
VPVVVREPPGGQARTTLTLTLRARCVSAAAKPCDDPAVAEAGPTPDNPVVAEWRFTETLTTVMHPCRRQDSGPDPNGRWRCRPTTSAAPT